MKAPLSKEAIARLLGTKPAQPAAPVNAAKPSNLENDNKPEEVQWRPDFDRWFKPTIHQETIDAIRADRKYGMKIDMIAIRHNVSRGYVSRICNNQVRQLNEK